MKIISPNTQKGGKGRSLPKLSLPNVTPLDSSWKGAVLALSFVTLCIVFVQAYYYLGSRGITDYFVGTLLSLVAILIVTGIIAGLLHWAKKIPSRYIWFMTASFCLLLISFLGPMPLTLLVLFSIILTSSLLGALLYRLMKGAYRDAARWVRVTAGGGAAAVFVLISVLGYWLTSDGHAELQVPYPLQTVKTSEKYQTTMADPSEPGAFRVKSITYASDPTYRKDLDVEGRLTTESVDGSAFVGNWSSRRTSTFGFGPEAMPLNGTVWYPDGDGPFPLVLIVHGNHLATDFSDPGYAYLGNLLASRGYILASIDENFLNISPYDDLFILDGLKDENRARGWLLLEHLKTWDEWNSVEGNPFYGQVDMQHIALMGHSRGGEAIAIAAAYNELTTYPEDANIKFDYHFIIRSLISIAGTDMQYKPSGQPIELQDINYLALHGSNDMDVNSFVGANQYYRTQFSDNSEFFKSYVYIYGANHGQFNTVWGRHDAIGVGNMLFNNAELLPGEQQFRAAEVLISSFLEATLKQNDQYRMVFKDLGYAREWLPETMYISNYWDGNTTMISSYEEDYDPGTTTLPGGRLEGESLKAWMEDKVKMELTDDQYSAVSLEWDNTAAPSTPAYKVILPDSGIEMSEKSTIVFSIANNDADRKTGETDALVDLTVSVEDKYGNVSRLPLSHVSPLLPMFEGVLTKRPLGFIQTIKEPIFQNFTFDVSDFINANSNLVPQDIRKISFVFDQTAKGNVMIKDIGIRNNKR
ncbi:MFS transporter [Paenibacillus sp. 7541]|uniref:MFS transporter n=1 Tax=Paenibacillus sp. 7541 TaxID=2026236 RepID=UPI0011409FDB|nr:MFS transporter [Paenibacillus sp. 7541]